MYEKIMKQLTPVYRAMIGAVALLVGIPWQIASEKTLDMGAFFIIAAAMLCFVNAFIYKVMKCETDIILYVVLNIALLIVWFALTVSEEITTGVVMYTVWGICVVAAWIVNAVLISCEDIFKRIVMGFLTTLFNVILIAVVFVVPVLIEVFF